MALYNYRPDTLLNNIGCPSQKVGPPLKKDIREKEYVGMLLKKVDQPFWQKPTLVSLFVNKGGEETMFLLTSAARTQFLSMDETRIYQIKVNGRCKTQVSLAKHAWPLKLIANQKAFPDLNQCRVGDFMDIVGRLVCKACPDPIGPNGIMKSVFSLSDGTYEEDIELLAQQASVTANVGDIVFAKGVVLKENKTRRFI